MKPSGKFQGFAASTPEHDMLQLWVSNPENQKKIVEVFRDQIGNRKTIGVSKKTGRTDAYGDYECTYEDIPCQKIMENIELKIEQPIYSGLNSFLIGIVDGWLNVQSSFNSERDNYKKTDFLRIIYEIKPKLNSISQAIGQIITYSDFLKRDREGRRMPPQGLLIITLDESTKFDNMLLEQGIRVLHVKESELIK